MSIIVKGMRMPENCIVCPMAENIPPGRTRCLLTRRLLADNYNPTPPERNEHCPLVDLGKHGDLIDRQKLIEDNKHLEYPTDGKYRRDRAWAVGFNAGARHCNEHAVYAKTVIEAEGADE